MDIRSKIEKWAVGVLGEGSGFSLVHPKELKNGDFTLIINGGNAEECFEKLDANKIVEIEKIVFVVPRFINIFLSEQFFKESIEEINKEEESFGKTDLFSGQKIMVEYTDPNPFKEFHIGHLMSNTIGEAVSRLIERGGADVKRANWQGDVGIHIAKAIWGKMQKPELAWGDAYAYGATNFEEKKQEITEINKKIYLRSDQKINELYDSGRKESLEQFEVIYKKLGTKFDHYFFESKEGLDGQEIVNSHIKDVFEESEGAIVFRGEKYDLHTRVFINSNGLPTYEAKELGLNKKKFDLEPDLIKSIIITGNEIKEYFKVLLKVIGLIYPKIAEKTIHLPHGMLRLPTGKMSSRTGNVITAESLIEEVKERVLEKVKERDFDDSVFKNEIAETVAIGAIKYSILRQAIGGDIIFDFEKSISFEGDSGPYLQYAAVRARSVLQNAKLKMADLGNNVEKVNHEVTEIERLLYRFPEIVERASKEYAPHHLVTYLTELASEFNSFYAREKIIDLLDQNSVYKIAITEAVFNTLKNGLYLLGIKVPERM